MKPRRRRPTPSEETPAPSEDLPLSRTAPTQRFRIFVLGAGFSHPAGLPLGPELLPAIRNRLTAKSGRDNHLEHDLSRYCEFLLATSGRDICPEDVELEEFLGFLDAEHFLGLKGKDTWSEDGNQSQLMVRHAIGAILLERTPTSLPDVYARFVAGLTTTDAILTFNYDTVLERALEQEGVPFRLFPYRFKRVLPSGTAIVDNSKQEVIVLKLHGSVDWVDRASYDSTLGRADEHNIEEFRRHPVFGPDRVVDSKPLVEGPRDIGDGLSKIYRISDPSTLYRKSWSSFTPFILTPSRAKLLYVRPLLSFWDGLYRSGGWNLGLNVVGYSLPPFDDYAVQALYTMSQNYFGMNPDLKWEDYSKRPVRLLQLADTPEDEARVRARFRFLDWSRTELWSKGLTSEAIDWLFS